MEPQQKILIVEDDSLLRELYSTKLSRAGYQIDTAYNGEEGFKQAKTFLPDLILLDVIMPKVDGYTMLKLLRAEPLTEHIPIVIMTNTPSLPTARECQELGVESAFFKSDVTPSQLVAYIKGYFQKQITK